jgi:DNA-directed RNA polymerase beta subunit
MYFCECDSMAINTRRLFLTPEERQKLLREKTMEGVKGLFPIIGTHHTIEADNIQVKEKPVSYKDHKKALFKGGSLYEPVKADLVVKDKEGNVIQRKKGHTVMHLPNVTSHNTFVVGGNEYALKHQLRTKPGVYTRRRGSDELESSFNLAKGANFRLSLNPEKGGMQMEYGSSKIPLYPILKQMGLQDNDISKYWGTKLVDRNRDLYKNKEESSVNKLFNKIVPRAEQALATNLKDKSAAILRAYDNTVLDEETTASTLKKGFAKVTPESLLVASKKLLKVYNQEEEEDERDSLEFQKVVGPEDIFKERIALKTRELQWKIRNKLDLAPKVDLKKIMPTVATANELKKFLSTAQLATLPSQINPVEVIDSALAVTRLGEGGISSGMAVPASARKLHSSMLGIIDPFRTPESANTGIDQRFSMRAQRDEAGNLYGTFKDKKGRTVEIPAKDIANKVIAFADQDVKSGRVDAMVRGKIGKVSPKEVDYYIDKSVDMYTLNTNMVPLLDSTQGNRVIMGAKMVGQAMPLVHREKPLVTSGVHGDGGVEDSFEHLVGVTSTKGILSEVDGTVAKVTKDEIHIKDAAGKIHIVEVPEDMPLASKTFLTGEVKVRPGDKVTKKKTILMDTNFTKDGTMALGRNLKVGYLAYHGLNSNDAVVMSKGATEKMASINMTKYVIEDDRDTVIDKNKHSANFPRLFTKDQYNKLDKGIVKVGTKLKAGDPISTVLRKRTPSIENQILGKVHKSLRQEYSDSSDVWDRSSEGEVIAVEKEGKRTTVVVKSIEKLKIGDKVSNRYGGKGVISKIVDDGDMVQDEAGKPIDILWSSLGVVSRINPSQVIETAAAKVAEKTGKPLAIQSFKKRNNVKWVRDLMKKHGVKDKETVFDPITGKKIPNIMVGPQYTYKLFKSSDTNYAARGLNGGYDVNDAPSKGGVTGAKGTGIMEINGLLAHDARDILKENAILKGTRNTEFWRAFQLGRPLPPPKSNFAFDKFKGMLAGAGLRFKQEGNMMSMAPMLDEEVRKMSNGEIENSRMVISKNLRSEKGGLFDIGKTGGVIGNKWTHIELPEPVVNPLFKDASRRLLGLTEKGLDEELAIKGGDYIKGKLNEIDVESKVKSLRAQLNTKKGSDKDNVYKQIKALKALKSNNLKPGDAYTMKAFPVLPPKLRPIVPGAKGDLLISDLNHVYKDLILAKQKLQEAKDLGLPDNDVKDMRKHMMDAAGAVIGTSPPVSANLQAKQVKGIVNTISGTKTGFFNGKILSRRLDFTGRGTAAPDPSLGMDEVGLPETMMWDMYSPFVIKNLVKGGYSAIQAKQMVDNKSSRAREELMIESNRRPVILNRAPSLHRFNMISFKPKPVEGTTIQVNPFMEDGMNLDYDGDALQVHVPVTAGAVDDAKKMFLSNNVLGDRNPNTILAYPKQEAMAGLYKATLGSPSGKVHKFKTTRDALAAYRRGALKTTDNVEIEDE